MEFAPESWYVGSSILYGSNREPTSSLSQSSFGFGQVGGTALVLHPRYLLGALEPTTYQVYRTRNRERALQSYKAMSEMMIMNSLVKVKDTPPYAPELEEQVLMNSMARATFDSKTGSYSFPAKLQTEVKLDFGNLDVVKGIVSQPGNVTGVGVDQGPVTSCILVSFRS